MQELFYTAEESATVAGWIGQVKDAATVLSTRNAVKFECGVTCGIHGMIPNASLAIQFRMDDPTGLCVGFHGTTEEMRQFAAELIRHCDAADEAERQQVAA